MALPTTRDITLASGTQIPSTLLNALQDMVVGGKHGSKRIQLTKGLAQAVGAFSVSPEIVLSATSSSPGFFSIPLHVGDRITAADVWIQDDTGGSETITVSIREFNANTGITTDFIKSITTTSDNSGTIQILNLDYTGGNELTLVTGVTYFVRVDPNASFLFSGLMAEVVYDRL